MAAYRRFTAMLLVLLLAAGLTACAPAAPQPQTTSAPGSPVAESCPTGGSKTGARTAHWITTYEETFDTPAALGKLKALYGPCIAGYDGYGDTTGKGTYRPEEVLSVHDGVLDWYVHTNASGQHVTAAPAPQGYRGQRYGRWTVRFRADEMPGYKLAFLLWPDSDHWPEGELDFPEAGLGGAIRGNAHDVTGKPEQTAFHVDTGQNTQAWHTAQITWLPGSVTFALDGVARTTEDPAAIPTTPMHWILQVETSLTGPAPAPAVAGHVQADWVRIENYHPKA